MYVPGKQQQQQQTLQTIKIPIGNTRKTIQIEYKKLIKIAYLVPKCWGNINCLKKNPLLPVIAEKTEILSYLLYQKVGENSMNGYYSWGIVSKASEQSASGKIETTVNVVLESWVRQSVNPGVCPSLQPCLLPSEVVKAQRFHPLGLSLQAKPSKWKLHTFFRNTCSSSWSCWGKQKRAPKTPCQPGLARSGSDSPLRSECWVQPPSSQIEQA